MSSPKTDLSLEQPSCDARLSRAQFLSKLFDKALLAGSLAVAPAIADAFLAPQKAAAASGGRTGKVDGTGTTDGTGVGDGTGSSDGTGALDGTGVGDGGAG